MKTKKLLFCLLFWGTITIPTSCSNDSDKFEPEQQEEDHPIVVEDNIDTDVDLPEETDDELVSNGQDLSSLTNAVFIVFNTTGDATVSDLENVQSNIKGNHIIINSTANSGVNYVLTGETTDGSITFTSDNKFNLYLNGVSITNSSGAAINSTQKAVSVVIQDNTQNRLIDAKKSSDKAAFYSKGKMDFSGNGLLEIRGKAKHAISSGNGITINSGTIYVKEAANDAIHGDGITITGGTLTAYASGEGLDADDVGSIDISGGTITIVTTGQKGHGIKTSSDDSTGEKGTISIRGGILDITTTGIASKALNSDSDITISGGNLLLKTTGNAYYDSDENDTSSAAGIKCDGNLLVENNAEITIKSTGSGGKGINTGGDFLLSDGTLQVITTGNTYQYSSNYTSSPKGIKAENITINSGTCTTSSAYHEGIEGQSTITINGGTVESIAYDDGLNTSSSNSSIVINGGFVYVYGGNSGSISSRSGIAPRFGDREVRALSGDIVDFRPRRGFGGGNRIGTRDSSESTEIGLRNGFGGPGGGFGGPGGGFGDGGSGSDGIDSNGSILITGGIVIVSGSGSPEEAFDCDNRNFTINGGIIIGIGGQNNTLPTNGSQYSIAYGGASLSAGDYVQLKNAAGESLIVYKMPRTISDMKMILSHPSLTNGNYTLVTGGDYAPGTDEFHGYHTGGMYSDGTSTSFTINSTVTKVGNVSSGGMGGNNNGGRPW